MDMTETPLRMTALVISGHFAVQSPTADMKRRPRTATFIRSTARVLREREDTLRGYLLSE